MESASDLFAALDRLGIRTIAYAVLGNNGRVREANPGFAAMFDLDPAEIIQAQVSTQFVSPAFEDLLRAAADGVSGYEGLLTLANGSGSFSVRARVHARADAIELVAEHDIEEIRRLHASVMELNEELGVAQLELSRTIRELRRRDAEISRLMMTDSLTGLPNRRQFNERMAAELDRRLRYGIEVGVALMDLDHFKQINDRHGHLIGDRVLVAVAELLMREKRKTDFIARWGGEEFMILLPETNLAEALSVLERLRRAMETLRVPPVTDAITGSFGLTVLCGDSDETLRKADLALYASKNRGRNIISTSS